jgi:hypothetical protein
MELTPEELQELQDLRALLAEDQIGPAPTRYTPGASPVGGGAAIPTSTTMGMEIPSESRATLSRYGIPLATALATGGASIPVQMGAGAISSLIGEGGALAAEGKDLTSTKNLRRMAGSTAIGMVPAIRNAPFYSALMAGAGNLGGEMIARGEDIGKGEAALLGGLPFAPSAVAGGLSSGMRGLSQLTGEGSRVAEAIERIGPNVRATLGQAIPRFASYEQRASAKVGREALDQFLTRQGESIAQAIENIAGGPVTNRQVVDNILAGMNVRERGDLVAQIGQVNSAYQALQRTQDPVRRQIIQDSIVQTEQQLQNRIVNQFMGGMPGPSRFVQEGGELAADMQQARNVFSQESSRRYAPIEPYVNVRGFDLNAPVAPRAGGAATSIGDEVQRAFRDAPVDANGQVIPAFTQYFSRLNSLLQSQTPATLGELRTIRDNLYDAADHAGSAFGKSQQRSLQNIANKITQAIDDQAPAVMGAGPARELADANSFYSKYRPRFDQYGVQNAFASLEKRQGQMSKQMVSQAAGEGLDTSSFRNYISLLDDMAADRVPGTPTTARAINIIRTGLLNTVIDRVGDNPVIDFESLSRLANNLENQSPGSLARLGLGNRDDINRLINFQRANPRQAGTEQLITLLGQNQPAGALLAPAIIAQIRGAQDIGPLMDSLRRNAVNGPRATRQAARQALIDVRANEINDLLVQLSETGAIRPGTSAATRTGRLESVQELTDPDMLNRYRTTIGAPLLNRIQRDIIPGFAALQRARRAAGQAGATVGGTAFENPVRSAGNLPASIAGGRWASAFVSFLNDVKDLAGYQILSRVFAQAGGATGLRDSSRQLELLSRSLSGLSRAEALKVLSDYADTGIIGETVRGMDKQGESKNP